MIRNVQAILFRVPIDVQHRSHFSHFTSKYLVTCMEIVFRALREESSMSLLRYV